MFLSQIIGALMGCVLAPATFYLIYNAFPDIGTPGTLPSTQHLFTGCAAQPLHAAWRC